MNRPTHLAALESGDLSGRPRRRSVWSSRRATLFAWQAAGLVLGAALIGVLKSEVPVTDSWRIAIDTLTWAWLAAFASAMLLDTLVARQSYLHFTVALVSVAASFGALFVGFLATHAPFSRGAILIGLGFTLAVHLLAWHRWRRRTTLRLGVLDDDMLERMAPASRFGAEAATFERCEWLLLPDPAQHDGVDGLVLPDDLRASVRQGAALRAKLAGVQVYSESFMRGLLTGRLDLERADAVFLDDVPTSFIYAAVKRLLDIAGALVLGVFALPVTLVCVACIRIESPGGAMLLQPRVGQRGKLFRMFKLRTMREPNPNGANDGDDPQARITGIGRWLRRSRLDELPQLLNVLRGEMSLIGPRPEWTGSAAALERQIPQYAFRYLVRPGITGWAQVHQGHVTAERAVREKLEYDLYYAKNMSLALDLAIGALTVRTVVTGKGAR